MSNCLILLTLLTFGSLLTSNYSSYAFDHYYVNDSIQWCYCLTCDSSVMTPIRFICEGGIISGMTCANSHSHSVRIIYVGPLLPLAPTFTSLLSHSPPLPWTNPAIVSTVSTTFVQFTLVICHSASGQMPNGYFTQVNELFVLMFLIKVVTFTIRLLWYPTGIVNTWSITNTVAFIFGGLMFLSRCRSIGLVRVMFWIGRILLPKDPWVGKELLFYSMKYLMTIPFY